VRAVQPRARTFVGLAIALVICLLDGVQPSAAHAYEDQWTLGVGLGYAHAFPHDAPHPGALAELSASLGLDPVWSVRARLSAAFHPDDHALYRGMAGGELLYMIDILELVPSFGLGVDAIASRSDAKTRADFALHAVLGLDYLLSRTLTLGFDVRPYLLAARVKDEPLYLALSASLVWMFDQ
jgi:hypothetical protein